MYRLATALTALLVAAAATTSWRDRVKAIQQEAQSQQSKLNFSRDNLYAQYPTPEMTFEGDAPKLNCGKSVPIELHGTYPKGTQLVVHSDDAQLDNLKVTTNSLQGILHVSPQALPGPIELEAITPVSGASTYRQIAQVEGSLKISLKYPDGWTALVETAGGCRVHFNKGKAQRGLRCELTSDNEGLRVAVEQSEEAQKINAEQATQGQAMLNDKGLQEVMKKMGDCGKLPQAEQMQCIQSVSKEAREVSDRMKKDGESTQAALDARRPNEAWACEEIRLRGSGGKLEGTATCARGKQDVSGSMTCQ